MQIFLIWFNYNLTLTKLQTLIHVRMHIITAVSQQKIQNIKLRPYPPSFNNKDGFINIKGQNKTIFSFDYFVPKAI